MSALRLAVAGSTGRMGTAIVRLAAADPRFQLVAAVAHPADPQIGRDAGTVARVGPLGIVVEPVCGVVCDVLIEFTTPAGCAEWAGWCSQNAVALVSGTTGLAEPQQALLRTAATQVPVLWAPNMSVGVNLLAELIAAAAARLGEDWDVEIVEAHHRHKVDAPSGTARGLLEAVCQARGRNPEEVAVFGRAGTAGPRPPGQIGVHAVRMGELVGSHQVTFASAAETLCLAHHAHSRDTFAAGALRAARWLHGRPPGLYAMRDVLRGAAKTRD